MPEVESIKLIPDEPIPDDSFGSHRYIASAIHELIALETGGKAIGLAGRFGVGKSTVVRLLEALYAPPDDDSDGTTEVEDEVFVWFFDAWAHEGDPLRRTFLELLVTDLRQREWIPAKKAEEALEAIAGSTSYQRSVASPRLSTLGSLVVLSAVLIPVGGVFLATAADQGLTLRFGFPVDWMAVLGAVLMLAPALVALGGAVFEWCSRSWKERALTYFDWSVASRLVAEERKVETTTTTQETPDPTSLEFGREFVGLLDHGLSDVRRQLVIVLDNLDRVAAPQALALWSTLQTFLSLGRKPSWFDRIWFIVPYDDEAISRLWKNTSAAAELAGAFVEKTFDVVFRVPPPIRSDWREYLLEHLKMALPDREDAELQSVATVYSLARRNESRPPTPREIKVFVNQIGALLRVRGKELNLSVLAYHTVLRRRGVAIIDQLRNAQLPETHVRPHLPRAAAAELAAIEFGVSAQSARQLLLETPIKTAIATGDAGALDQLSDLGTVVLWPALAQTIGVAVSEWEDGQSALIPRVLATLADTKVWSSAPSWLKNSVQKSLYAPIDRLKLWSPVEERFAADLASYTENLPPECSLQALTRIVEATIGREFGADVPRIDQGIEITAAFLDAVGSPVEDTIPLKVTRKLDLLAEIYEHVLNRDPTFTEPISTAFDARVSNKTVAQHITKMLGTKSVAVGYPPLVRALVSHRPKVSWDEVLTASIAALNARQPVDASMVSAVIQIALHLALELDEKTALESLVVDGHLAHHFFQCDRAGDQDAMAWLSVAILKLSPSQSGKKQIGQSANGWQKLDRVLAQPSAELSATVALIVQYYRTHDWLLQLHRDNTSLTQYSGKALKAVAERYGIDGWLTSDLMVEYWDFILDWIHPEHLLGSNLLSEVSDRLNDGPTVKEASRLYVLLVKAGLESNLGKDIRSFLVGLTMAQWKQAISQQSDIYDLAVAVAEKTEVGFLGGDLELALVSIAKEALAKDTRVEDGVSLLSVMLTEDSCASLRESLWEAVYGRSGDVSESFLFAFGDELIASGHLENKNKPITQFLIPMVEQRNLAGMAWLAEELESDPSILGTSDQPYRRQLQKLLDQLCEETTGTAPQLHGTLKTICQTLASQ